jgi:outer membrane protein assembly factor BamC
MSSVTRFPSDNAAPTAVRLACLIALASLSACSSLDFSSDKVDYRTGARQTQGLDVPPDLTQLARVNTRPSDGIVSASQMQSGARNAPTSNAAAAADSTALSKIGELSVERSGPQRWLHSAASPEQLWPQVRGFWQERGFELAQEDAAVGLMETNWAENRAKLPQDFIRKTVGSLLDSLYSTGERDKYRTRLERNPNGGTDIFVTHRGMQEVYTNGQRDQTAWQPRPSDPELEAEMLSRLLLKLGGKEEMAKAVVKPDAQAKTSLLPASPRAARSLDQVPDTLQVNEGFERAWRRVGQSLDRHGFTIEDRDRKQGLFFLRYADPNMAGKEEPGFWAKLFGAESKGSAVRYRVSVKSEGEKSTVSVLDDKGQQQSNEIAKRILNLLMDDLR